MYARSSRIHCHISLPTGSPGPNSRPRVASPGGCAGRKAHARPGPGPHPGAAVAPLGAAAAAPRVAVAWLPACLLVELLNIYVQGGGQNLNRSLRELHPIRSVRTEISHSRSIRCIDPICDCESCPTPRRATQQCSRRLARASLTRSRSLGDRDATALAKGRYHFFFGGVKKVGHK